MLGFPLLPRPYQIDGVSHMSRIDTYPALREAAGLIQPKPLRRPATSSTRYAGWARRPVGQFLLLGDTAAFIAVWLIFSPPVAAQLAALAVLVVASTICGLYRSRLSVSVLDDLPYIVGSVAVAILTAVGLDSGLSQSTQTAQEHGKQLSLLLLLVPLVRFVAYQGIRSGRSRGWVRHEVLVIGAGHVGTQLVSTMRDYPEHGLDPLGFVDDDPRVLDHADLPAPLLGGCSELPAILDSHSVRAVIIAFGSMKESQLVDVLRACDRRQCEIWFIPRLFEMHSVMRSMDDIRGIPLVRVRRAAFRTVRWRMKRIFDAIFAALALILLSPVLFACALAVRYEIGSSVLFQQERVGLDGRPFVIYKFRSLQMSPHLQPATTWTVPQDYEVGPVGRFLRRTSIDELPQLWNVLIGDMSLVGPRPERPHFATEFGQHIPRYAARCRVPAGLTGWAQVNGLRGDTSIQDRAAFDNYYIENWSLWSDVKIILRTIRQVVSSGGS